MSTPRANAFDLARSRLQAAKRRKHARAQTPEQIVPAEPVATGAPLEPSRLDAARTRLRLTIPPKTDEQDAHRTRVFGCPDLPALATTGKELLRSVVRDRQRRAGSPASCSALRPPTPV